jgi:hypothetical protein
MSGQAATFAILLLYHSSSRPNGRAEIDVRGSSFKVPSYGKKSSLPTSRMLKAPMYRRFSALRDGIKGWPARLAPTAVLLGR